MSVISREFIPGIYLIQECVLISDSNDMATELNNNPQDWYNPGRDVHIVLNAFLFVGEKTLLFDTLSGLSSDHIVEELRHILGNKTLDYVVISHTDVPHCANAFRLLKEYPEATLVAPQSGSTHGLFHLGDATKVGPGDMIDLGGHVLKFHEAIFLDAAISHWMTEENAKMLLTVDWMGFPHSDGECGKCVDELETEVTVSRLLEHHARVFIWYQYVDVPKTHAEIDRIIETFKPSIIASAHGSVIRKDATKYLQMMKPVIQHMSDQGRLGNF